MLSLRTVFPSPPRPVWYMMGAGLTRLRISSSSSREKIARQDPKGGILPAPPRPVEKRVLDDDFVLEECEALEVVVVKGWW